MLVYHAPYAIMNLLRRQLVKNTIGTRQHIVQFLTPIFLKVYVWVANNHIWITTKLWLLCFQITECSADRKPSWKYPIRTNQRIIHCILLLRRFLHTDLLQLWLTLSVYYRVRLIDMATSGFNPPEF